jgi:glycosyltransferase involved in cell wall biosynthesis
VLRVLFVTSTFPRSDEDDQVPWLLELAMVLCEKGVELEVLAPAYSGLQDHQVFGIPVHRYRYAPRPYEVVTHEAGAMNKMAGRKDLALPAVSLVGAGMAAAARLCRRKQYDAIHSHWPLPMGLSALAGAMASRKRPRLVATFHGAEVALAKRNPHYRPALRLVARTLDAAVANSSATAATVQQLTGIEPSIIPFGAPRGAVSFDKVVGEPEAEELPLVLSVGRMIERKGFPVLVRAAKHLRGRARVVIAGSGEYEEVVQKEIERTGTGDVVSFAGGVSSSGLSKLYDECSVFCLPAVVDARGETEGLGVVLIEAMSHGKPVVASRLGGIVDAVEDGETGVLVSPEDPEALTEALLRVVEDPELGRRLGEAGRERAVRLFSWGSIAERHMEVYSG